MSNSYNFAMAVISLDDHLTVKASAASGLLYVRNVFANLCMCTHVCARPRFLFHGKGSFLDEISRLSTAYPAQDSILDIQAMRSQPSRHTI